MKERVNVWILTVLSLLMLLGIVHKGNLDLSQLTKFQRQLEQATQGGGDLVQEEQIVVEVLTKEEEDEQRGGEQVDEEDKQDENNNIERKLFLNPTGMPHHLGILHLGKTGGSGLRTTLEGRHTYTMIQRKNPQWFHMESPDPFLYDEWIAVVRDPIERVKSNYVYEHPENSYFRKDKVAVLESRRHSKLALYKCFHTIEDLAVIGLNGDHHDPTCDGLLRRLFGGLDEPPIAGMSHMTYNFKAYFGRLLNRPNATLWLVRNEHMMEDLNAIDIAMGGKGLRKMKRFEHTTTNGRNLPVKTRHVSPFGIHNLCRALCSEIQIYKKLFRAAKNVDMTDFYGDPKSVVAHQCPHEAHSNTCPPFSF